MIYLWKTYWALVDSASNNFGDYNYIISRLRQECPDKVLRAQSAKSSITSMPRVYIRKGSPDAWLGYHTLALLFTCDGTNFGAVLWMEKKYLMLPQFALAVLTLPHSYADTERLFSKNNLTKTKIRNKHATKIVKGALLSAQCVKNQSNECCYGFKPTEKMISRMTSAVLYPKTDGGASASASDLQQHQADDMEDNSD
ncbi:unnamed protein product [Euphydryas editha]|uniref:HAT C-terminal dimerisation domain-containing protein n=1 Tax=Euphydryas editha TaxID=104508 RepID=A0AAU9UYP1_EUPED|nr:unnamed protein product [Euphydryas editha]